MSELPKGWADAELGDAVVPIETDDPRKKPESHFVYVDIGAIDNKTQRIVEARSLSGAEAPSRARRVIRNGDVLFSTVRTYLKNIAMVPPELDGQITSTGIAVLRASEAVDARYIFNLVRSDEFIRSVSLKQDGTLYPAITDNDLLTHKIKLPPLAEQKRIVAKLDSLSAKSARARIELARIDTLVTRYKQAVLSKAFTGELTKKWRVKSVALPRPGSIDEILKMPIRNGLSVKGREAPPGVRALKLSALRGQSVNMNDVRYLPIDNDRARRFLLENGDILVSRGNGTKELVGISSLVPSHSEPTIFPDTAFRIRINIEQALPNWLAHIWNAPQCRLQIEKAAKTTAGIWKISQRDLSGTKLLIPSVDEQHEIVRRIESAFEKIDRLAAEAKRALELVGKLDEAILAKAFRGELVPQDPNDEPASVLLDRIKAERAAAPKTKRGRGNKHTTLETRPSAHGKT